MERIAEDGERNTVLLHQPQQLPEVRVQNRVAASNVKIRQAVIERTEVQAVIKGVLHLLPGHCIQLFIAVLGENVAVLAPLVAFIRDMPLEEKYCFMGSSLLWWDAFPKVKQPLPSRKYAPRVFLGCIPYTLLLVAGATGRTAGGGLLGGLVGSAAGRTASSGLLSGLVGSTASRSRGGSRLLVPAKEIRKSHGCLPPNNIQWAFRPPVPLLYLKHISGTSTHNFIT